MAYPDEHYCFIIMPFRPEFYYFFLYLQNHIKDVHKLDCRRGDSQVTTVPLMAKLNESIERAAVVIADCTGDNANVFYELGLAHALGKKVIHITSDPVEKVPTDIRHHQFISYSLGGQHDEFFRRLDGALLGELGSPYLPYYESARSVLADFNWETDSHVPMPPNKIVFEMLHAFERARGTLPPPDDYIGVAQIVMQIVSGDPRLIVADQHLVRRLSGWLTRKQEQLPPPQLRPPTR